jgi:hypothetical protein
MKRRGEEKGERKGGNGRRNLITMRLGCWA